MKESWAPTGIDKGGDTASLHGPSLEKLKSVIAWKNSITEVSLNGHGAAFSWRETVNDCSTPIILFISVYYKITLFCCTRILKRMNGWRTRPPRLEIGKPIQIVSTFNDIHRRSGAKIVVASGYLEDKNCTDPWLVGGGSFTVPFQELHPRLGLPFALLWKTRSSADADKPTRRV